MRYMAPELYSICDEENEDSIPRVTVATDVWGYAMTIIEVRVYVSIFGSFLGGLTPNVLQIFTGSIPFSHTTNDASIILYVKAGGRPKRRNCRSINDEIWAMLERCWDVEPNRRPPMNTLLLFFTSLVE
jgi:serine/threonine protein kinase